MSETKEPIAKTIDDQCYLIERNLYVETKGGDVVPFKLNVKQKQLKRHIENTQKPRRIVILKGRQFGVSTFIVALYFMKCLTVPNTRAVVISHEKEATVRLFSKVKFFLDRLPVKPKLDKESERHYTFPSANSSFYIGTAGSRAFGRGDNITDLHCSEVAYWENAPTIMNGLLQAVSKDGQVFIETTANGMGGSGAYLYRLWSRSYKKKSTWNSLFLKWTDFDEYEMDVPKDFVLNDEETHLKKLHPELNDRKFAWRRWKIEETEPERGLTPEQIFNQEYPLTPQEAFIASGNCIFNTKALMSYQTSEGESGAEGITTWHKQKTSEIDYTVMFIDVAEGVTLQEAVDEDVRSDLDSHAIQILDRHLNQIAEWKGKCDIDELARIAGSLASTYKSFVGFEVNNQGIALANVFKRDKQMPLYRMYHREVIDENYNTMTKKLGWHTNAKTKPVMVNDFVSMVRDHKVKINSPQLVAECLSTVRDENGKIDTQGKDLFMAMAGAIQMYKFKPPRMANLTDEQRQEKEKSQAWKLKRKMKAMQRQRVRKTIYG